jgi:hypothetical protein
VRGLTFDPGLRGDSGDEYGVTFLTERSFDAWVAVHQSKLHPNQPELWKDVTMGQTVNVRLEHRMSSGIFVTPIGTSGDRIQGCSSAIRLGFSGPLLVRGATRNFCFD